MCFINGMSKEVNSFSEHLNAVSEPVNVMRKDVNAVCEPVNRVSNPLNAISGDRNDKSEPPVWNPDRKGGKRPPLRSGFHTPFIQVIMNG